LIDVIFDGKILKFEKNKYEINISILGRAGRPVS